VIIADPQPPPSPTRRLPSFRARRIRPPKFKRREIRRGTRCLNCDTETTARFCPECGQENVDINISLWEIFNEAIQEFLQLDSKFLRTIVPLVTKPGKLTREWAAGRRVRYVSPLRLYLIVTAGFFLLLGLMGTSPFQNKHGEGSSPQLTDSRMEQKLPTPLRFVVHQLTKIEHLDGRQLGPVFMEQLPTGIFIMLPFFAAVVWILYSRNRRYYVEHVVFALHCHAFYFLVLGVMTVLPSTPAMSVWTVCKYIGIALIPIYSVLALKNNYQQGWIKTLIKSFMLGYAYVILIALAVFGSLIAAAAKVPDIPPPVASTTTTTK
jgi:hypothetical protein